MLPNFAVVIIVIMLWELGETNSFLISLFPTIITKEILGKNVTLTTFMGRITTIIVRG
jgi:hypothetical protein